MLEIFRNMFRRKLRTILTITGITVGIFAFTVMGSMALRFNKMISGGKSFITGQITVFPKGTSFTTGTTGLLPLDVLKRIEKVEGVEAVAAGVELALKEPDPDNPTGGAGLGIPPTIEGTDLDSGHRNRNWTTLDMKAGRFLQKGDLDSYVTVGYTIATDNNLKVGDKFAIRGRDFEVVGIVDQTLTGPDSYVFMPLKPARELLIESNPFLKSLKERSDEAAKISDAALASLPAESRKQILEARAFKFEDVTQVAAISWQDGQDPEAVVDRIKEQFKDEVMVLSPAKMGEQIDKASAIFNAIILGSAVIALIVGGFSIINTMIMSISERKKEIGIKKAIGASNSSIAWDYTLEAGFIGIVGGVIGMALGVLVAILINAKTKASGAEIFLIRAWFMAVVVGFSFVLGIIAGVIPALRASKMKVVDAIREL
ncbi:ABC transporter permease [Candidatus Parcubacteria bacterium]|jgi:putative ABC transport system permease protein|nr:MAG: ABC transporter permease [Candidatus Parcubacteria bacterium]